MEVKALLSLILLCLIGSISATHFRFGTISYRVPDSTKPTTVEFYSSFTFRRSYFGNIQVGQTVKPGTFNFGDGTKNENLYLLISSVNTDADWISGTFTTTHTYPSGVKTYTALHTSSGRILELNKNGNKAWNVSCTVSIGTTVKNANGVLVPNTAPVSNNLPIVSVYSNEVNSFRITATDAEGQALTYSLATAIDMGSKSMTLVPQLTVDATGNVTFDTRGVNDGYWCTQIKFSDGYTYSVVDFLIYVADRPKICEASCSNKGDTCTADSQCSGCTGSSKCITTQSPYLVYPPTPADGSSFSVNVDTPASFSWSAYTPNGDATIAVTTSSLPTGAVLTTTRSGNPQNQTLTWTPSSADTGVYVVTLGCADSKGLSCQGQSSFSINVAKQYCGTGTIVPAGCTPSTQSCTCSCTYSGFNASTQCYECKDGYYGSKCTACPACVNGICDDGVSGVGGCTCNVGWKGSDCSVSSGEACSPTSANKIVSYSSTNTYVNPSNTIVYLSSGVTSPLSLTLYTAVPSAPTKLDVLLLVDVTKSITSSMLNYLVDTYAKSFYQNVRSLVTNSYFGVASFTDEPTGSGCSTSDYPFRLHLPLSSDSSDFYSALSTYMKTTSLGCNDNTNKNDAQLDALVQASASSVGWRSDAYKILIMVTDSTFWDGVSVYNSRSDARAALIGGNIIPIFLTTSGVLSTYSTLTSYFGFGSAVSVTSSYSNVYSQAYSQMQSVYNVIPTVVATDTYGFVSAIGSASVTVSPPVNKSNTISLTYPSGQNLDSLSSYPEISIAVMGWGTASITAQVNRAPVPAVCTATTREDISVEIPISATDPDGNALFAYVSKLPTSGTLVVSKTNTTAVKKSTQYRMPDGSTASAFYYTPNTHVSGSDTFQYYITDGCSVSATITCSITITDYNYPPEAEAAYFSTNENVEVLVTMTGSDVETAASSLRYVVTGLPDATLGVLRRVSTGNAVVVNEVMNAGENQLRFVPVTYACCDIATFTFLVKDAEGQTSSAESVDVEIFGVNQVPTPSATNVAVERGATVAIVLKAWDPDTNDVETFTVTSVSAGTGSFTTASNVAITANRNVSTVTVDSSGNAAATVYYNAPADKSGNNYASLSFKVSDSANSVSSVYTVYVSVNTANSAPTANPAGPIPVFQDSSSAVWSLNGTDTDAADAKALKVQIVALPSKGTLYQSGVGSIASSVTLPFTLSNASVYYSTTSTGEDTFAFRVMDLMGATSTQQVVRVIITAVNHAPTATFLAVTTPEDTLTTMQISPYDQDGDTMSVIMTSLTKGTFYQYDGTQITRFPTTLSDSQFRFKFLGALNEFGTPYTTFTFYVSDNQGKANSNTSSVTGTINVTPVNDPPVAIPITINILENSGPVNITLNATDVETPTTVGAFLVSKPSSTFGTIKKVNGDSLDVRTTVAAPRIVTFYPSQYTYGTTTFTFGANDGDVDSDNTATGTIVITHVNHAPFATATSPVTATRSVPLTVTIVARDYDVGDDLTVKITSLTGAGVLSYNGVTISAPYTLPGTFTIPSSNSKSISLSYLAPATATPGSGYGSMSFTVTDQGGLVSNTTTVSFSIASNNAPTANPAGPLPVVQDYTSAALPLNGTDVDVADANSLTVVIVSLPTKGKLYQGTSSTQIATANSDLPSGVTTVSYYTTQRGSDSFTFAVRDLLGSLSSTVTVTIPITNTNHAPSAYWVGTAVANEDTQLTINNIQASDPDGDTVTIKITVGPTSGVLTQYNGDACVIPCTVSDSQYRMKFTPLANEHSENGNPYASITFVATDGTNTSQPVTGGLYITAVNDAPVARNSYVATPQNTNVVITLDASDVDTAMTDVNVTIQSIPSSSIGAIKDLSGNTLRVGSVLVGSTVKQLQFYPTTWATGATSFSFSLFDGELSSTTATVTVNVTAVYQVPICSVSPASANVVGRATSSSVQLSVFDPDQGETYTFYMTKYSWASGGYLESSTTHQNVTETTKVLADQVTTASNYYGNADFVYNVDASESATYLKIYFVVFDGTSNSSECWLQFNSSTNSPPTANPGQSITLYEDESTDVITVNGTDTDNFGALLNVVIIDIPQNGVLFQASTNTSITAKSTQLIDGEFGVYYTPNSLWNGTDYFTYVVKDAAGALSSKARVNFTVIHVNHAPTIYAGSTVTTLEDTTITISQVVASDVDVGDVVKVYLRSPPGHGQFAQSDNTLISNDINDYPVWITSSVADFKFIPAADANGDAYASFTVFAKDNSNAESGDKTVVINVTPVDDPPVAHPVEVAILEQTSSTAILTFKLNATDVDTLPADITATVLSLPSSTIGSLVYPNGTAVAVGDVVYDPLELGFTPLEYTYGNTSFSFRVKDQTSYSTNSATVSISVTHVNHDPTANAVSATAVRTVPLTVTLSGSDKDSGDVFSFVVDSATPGTGGEFTNADGTSLTTNSIISSNVSNTASRTFSTVLYYTAPVLASGSNFANLTYHIVDQSSGTSASQTLTIDIAANSAPIATPVSFNATQDTPSEYVVLNGTDVDPADAGSLSLVIATLPSQGVLIVNSTFNVTTAHTAFHAGVSVSYYTTIRGTDSFTFYVVDNLGTVSGTANAEIRVIPVNHAPTAVFHGPATGIEDTNVTITQISVADSDGDTVSIYVTSLPESGLLTQYDGTPITSASSNFPVLVTNSQGWLIYVPAANQNGDPVATFSFYGDDGQGESNSKTGIVVANISVTAVNDAPVAIDGLTAANENSDDILITLNVTDVDTPLANLSVYLTSLPDSTIGQLLDPDTLTAIQLSVKIPSRKVLLRLVKFANGNTSFTFYGNDGQLDSATTATQTIAIASVNQAPTASAATPINAARSVPTAVTLEVFDDDYPETFNYTVVAYTAVGGYFSYDNVSFGSISASTPFVAVSNVSRSLSGNTFVVYFTAPANLYGSNFATLELQVFDAAGANSSITTIDVNVLSGSNPVAVTAGPIVFNEESTSAAFSLNGTDADTADANTLRVVITSLPTKATLYVQSTDGTPDVAITVAGTVLSNPIVYLVGANLSYGTDSFTFVVKDSVNFTSANSTVSIQINHVNHPPVAGALVTTGTMNSNLTFQVYGQDPDNDLPLNIYVTQTPAVGNLYQSDGTLIPSSTSATNPTLVTNYYGNLIYQGPTNKWGKPIANVSIYVDDSTGSTNSKSATYTFSLSLERIDLAPSVSDMYLSMLQNSALNFTIAVTDPQGYPTFATITTFPLYGNLYRSDGTEITTTSPNTATDKFVSYVPPTKAYDDGVTPYATITYTGTATSTLNTTMTSTVATGTIFVNRTVAAPVFTGATQYTIPDNTNLTMLLTATSETGNYGMRIVSTVASDRGDLYVKMCEGGDEGCMNTYITEAPYVMDSVDMEYLIRYTPPANKYGNAFANFSVVVTDSYGESDPVTITINIYHVNIAPTIVPYTYDTPDAKGVTETYDWSTAIVNIIEGNDAIISWKVTDTDTDPSNLTSLVYGLPYRGSLYYCNETTEGKVAGAAITKSGASIDASSDGLFRIVYRPETGKSGTNYATFSLIAYDQIDQSSRISLKINVKHINLAPSVTVEIPNWNATTGTSIIITGVTVNDTDASYYKEKFILTLTKADGSAIPDGSYVDLISASNTSCSHVDNSTLNCTATLADLNSYLSQISVSVTGEGDYTLSVFINDLGASSSDMTTNHLNATGYVYIAASSTSTTTVSSSSSSVLTAAIAASAGVGAAAAAGAWRYMKKKSPPTIDFFGMEDASSQITDNPLFEETAMSFSNALYEEGGAD